MNVVSQTAEYALRAMVCLTKAHKDRPGETIRGPFIAEQTQVPAGYLLKVLQQLARADMVYSKRGVGGGFYLSCDPYKTTVYDVVQAVDQLPRIEKCPLGNPEHVKLCPLHSRIDSAVETVEVAFKNTALIELIETPEPLCLV